MAPIASVGSSIDSLAIWDQKSFLQVLFHNCLLWNAVQLFYRSNVQSRMESQTEGTVTDHVLCTVVLNLSKTTKTSAPLYQKCSCIPTIVPLVALQAFRSPQAYCHAKAFFQLVSNFTYNVLEASLISSLLHSIYLALCITGVLFVRAARRICRLYLANHLCYCRTAFCFRLLYFYPRSLLGVQLHVSCGLNSGHSQEI